MNDFYFTSNILTGKDSLNPNHRKLDLGGNSVV
jgi:hypothetical protein